jgi:hypothetical protein
MSFQDYLMAERREAVQEVEAERDAQTERAKLAEAQRDALSMEVEKLRNELARLQKQG